MPRCRIWRASGPGLLALQILHHSRQFYGQSEPAQYLPSQCLGQTSCLGGCCPVSPSSRQSSPTPDSSSNGLEAMSIEGLSRKRSGSIVSKHFESQCFIKSYCKELSHRSSEVFPCPGAGSGERVGQAFSLSRSCTTLGNSMGKANQPNTCRPSAWGKLPAWVVAAQSAPAPANQAPPLTVMTKDRISQELEGEPKGDSQMES